MRQKTFFRIGFLVSVLFLTMVLMKIGRAQKSGGAVQPAIPKTWDDEAMASLEVPPAGWLRKLRPRWRLRMARHCLARVISWLSIYRVMKAALYVTQVR